MGACEINTGKYFVFENVEDALSFLRDLELELSSFLESKLKKDLYDLFETWMSNILEIKENSKIKEYVEGHYTGLIYIEEGNLFFDTRWLLGEIDKYFESYVEDILDVIIEDDEEEKKKREEAKKILKNITHLIEEGMKNIKIKEVAKKNNCLGIVYSECYFSFGKVKIIEDWGVSHYHNSY